MEESVIELESLVGEHVLTGADHGDLPPDPANYRYESASTLRFVLDGKIYVAVEDPDDGYRSSLRHLLLVTEPPVTNTFEPVRVLGRMRTAGRYGDKADVLEFLRLDNGAVVLAVGTDNSDDY